VERRGYYRRRLRELVFEAPDRELRREIMAKLGHYRYKLWRQYQMRRLFDDGFALRLRAQRCDPPRPLEAPLLHRHDVIMQEAIKFVERWAADALREEHHWRDLPEIFSRREERTGEPDKEIEALSA
jgi:hypothetical protein